MQLPPHLARYAAVLDDYAAFVESLHRPLPQSIAANGTRVDAARLGVLTGDHLTLQPIPWFPGAFRLDAEDRPGRHWTWSAGLYSVQEEASLVPVRMLDVRPGHRVLDLCAAPGNKTAQIAVALGGTGTLIANDVKRGRLTALNDTSRRLGLVNLTTTAHDGTVYPVADGQFDRILVDAPCTAEGKARRGIVRDSSPQFRRWVAGTQRALLRRAAALVKPGGRIVYSTCTFAPEENEAVLSDVLAAEGGRLRTLAPDFEVPGAAPGLDAFDDRRFDPGVTHARRLWPQRTDTGGFFAVILERIDDAPCAPPPLRRLPEPLPASQVAPYVEAFDLPPGTLDGFVFFEDAKHLRVLCADHAPPAGIGLELIGMDLARRRSDRPKLSTAGAMLLGAHARAGRIELDAAEREAYRRRETLPVAPERDDGEQGTRIVTHQQVPIGTAFLRLDETGARLESQFPKAWARAPIAPPQD